MKNQLKKRTILSGLLAVLIAFGFNGATQAHPGGGGGGGHGGGGGGHFSGGGHIGGGGHFAGGGYRGGYAGNYGGYRGGSCGTGEVTVATRAVMAGIEVIEDIEAAMAGTEDGVVGAGAASESGCISRRFLTTIQQFGTRAYLTIMRTIITTNGTAT